MEKKVNDRILPTADCRPPTTGCRLPTADCRLFSAGCRLPTADCRLFSADCRLFSADCRLPTANRPFPSERGFTLIELLLVMVILTVLAAVVVPKFTKRSEQARITAAHTDISNVEVALDAFEIDTGRYPTTNEGLKVLVEEPSNTKNWKGPYIKRGIPNDPWGNAYVYEQPGKHNTSGFDLTSYGSDGAAGGDDDIDNWTTR